MWPYYNLKLIDLTQEISEHIPSWDLACGFNLSISSDYDACQTKTRFRVQNMQTPLGIGTHIDAPAHCCEGGADVAAIHLQQLFVAAYVLDVSAKAHQDYFVTEEDILQFEEQNGNIAENSLFLIYTGWAKKWHDSVSYRNEDSAGHKFFPGISAPAAALLLARNVVGIGIDTLSPDGSDQDFPVHHLILGAGKYILENLTNLQELPAVGSQVLVAPMKIKGATEAPCRITAIIP